MKKFNKKKLPSRHTSLGPDKAPQRSFYYAMDLTEKDVAKPFVGVVSTWNEAAPCNIALMRQAQSVKKGVHQAGGTPREFCTITVTDGIAMGHEGMKSSLISRDVIADSTELTVRGHCYDALVGVAGCDKSLPGLMMAMVRLNVPSVFIYGGSILPGRFNGKDVTVVDVFEGVGKFSSGKMSANALRKHQKWTGVPHFHRGSPFMKAIYESKELALKFDKKQEVRKAPASGYSDDKWNPGDIWMSTYDPNPSTSKPLDYGKGGESCNLTFELLKKDVQKEADKKRLLGVSLKKVEKTATVTEYNLPKREQNIGVTLSGFRFGQTGNFFESTDVYLIFNKKEMQFRSFNTTKSWQGEVKGTFAAGGKIGGGGVNFYCSDILNNPIATNSKDSMKWKETTWNDGLFDKFHDLYIKYSKHKKNVKKVSGKNVKDLLNLKEFKQEANRYTFRNKNASAAFKFSKYMGLQLIDALYGKNHTNLNEWAAETLRYAMSNIDISSYFIKIE